MANQDGKENAFDPKDFMLAEYQNHLEEYQRSEQLGEARLNLFLTIATAVLGGSGLLIGSDISGIDLQDLLVPLFFAYLATFFFGILTLLRMIRRNLVSSRERRAINRIRRYFVHRDRSILCYLDDEGPYDDKPMRKWRLRGGLVDTVMLANALLAAVLAFTYAEIMLSPLSNWIKFEQFSLHIGIYAFLISCVIQYTFVKHKYDEERQKVTPKIRFPRPKEVEISLLILSENPESAASEIESLTYLSDYELIPQSGKDIHDIYLDTPDKKLGNRKFALRIREVAGSIAKVTLKGPSIDKAFGVKERTEIEEDWSKSAWEHVIKELLSHKIELPQKLTKFSDDKNGRDALENPTPEDMITQYKLDVIQDRETCRTIRNIVCLSDAEDLVLAELAIDRVVYHLDNNIKLWTIELEAKVKSPIGGEAIKNIANALLIKYPSNIRVWRYSKLETGKAIESLFRDKVDFEKYNDGNDLLKLSAYERIESYLKGS